ncbi:MAG: ABC transporter ATP-binding protein [Deltaproteobacteria bacterium]|nr:ABC transporter ATP-binding protein [Deltaproteobacteria bacterium]
MGGSPSPTPSPPSLRATIIEAVGLERRFGDVPALASLSLGVQSGEIYGLVGPDGAGKTTALRILAGVIAATDGHALIQGRDPLTGASKVRASIGYMPQQYSLYGDLTIDENLRFFARMFCLKKAEYEARRAKLLDITRLQRFTDRRAEALSGGMYKKLALACALLHRPAALILDEPTNGVDPISRRELWALLFRFAQEGMAILVSTAYMDEAARCHRVGLLHRGRLLLEGRPADLTAALDNPVYSVVFDPTNTGFNDTLMRHRAIVTASLAQSEFRIVVECGAEAEVTRFLADGGATWTRVAPNLEELFLVREHEASRSTPRTQPTGGREA